MKRLIFVIAILAAGATCYAANSEPTKSRSDRVVRIINECLPSAVNTIAYVPVADGSQVVGVGAGSVVHEKGFILTNNPVAADAGYRTASLLNGETYPYRVIWLEPEMDLAIIKIDSPRPLKPIKLGRSNDLMEGETVITIGNPAGMTHTVTTGIISAVIGDRKNATTIQTDTAVNPGNSGGPLINALGELIGVVNSKRTGVRAISFATPIDRARETLAANINDINCTGYTLGAVVNAFGEPRVTEVKPDSPAANAGLKVGDLVTSAGGLRVSDSLHFYVAMLDRQPGEEFPMRVQRGGKTLDLKPVLAGSPPHEPVEAPNAVPGVTCAAYIGQFPNCDELAKVTTPAQALTAAKITHLAFTPGGNNYGLKFTGYINAPAEGAYRFYVVSDDGSKLFIGDELVVDNDGHHPPKEVDGVTNLKAGLHPFTLYFFQGDGGAQLSIYYEGPGIGKQEIPPEALFTTE